MSRPTDPHRIEIRLRNLSQLFNSMDPSPFHEKDLDHDAEEFIESWADEFPIAEPVALLVHLETPPPRGDAAEIIRTGVQHHFAERARLARLEFRRLLQRGRTSLIIGLSFLAACLAGVELIGEQAHGAGTLLAILRESLLIGGWVAMWRPLELYLYDWWPLRRRVRLHGKLSTMAIEVRPAGT